MAEVNGETVTATEETQLVVGPQAIDAYRRLSYTMWYALAEFIDNSTQSRSNYGNIIDDVLKEEGVPLTVDIVHNRQTKQIIIKDNSIGMNHDKLVQGLKIANPTKDSVGRSKYGMGMKTAACWIGRHWKVVTCEWDSGEEWTAEVDVQRIAQGDTRVPLTRRTADKNSHYTHIIISELHRTIQKRTEETIRAYLGSMYQFDIQESGLKLVFNNEEITAPDAYEFDTDPEGKPYLRDLQPQTINGKPIKGWFGILKKGGRRFGGFSLFQNRRQIQGFPNAWKPKLIYGGVDDEGANNLISQRLTGVIELDGFDVSHTKDTIQWSDNEEDELETFLATETKDYRDYAQKRRTPASAAWSPEKFADLVQGLKNEFTSPEMQDALNTTTLPPLEMIQANNQAQVEALTSDDTIDTWEVSPELRISISFTQRSENDPYLIIQTGAEAGKVHVIINGLHPYYCALESSDAINECIRLFAYDALAEYKVSKLVGRVNPDSIRRLKDSLLRVQEIQVGNAAAELQEGQLEVLVGKQDI